MSELKSLHVEVGVARLTLNRPQAKNAINVMQAKLAVNATQAVRLTPGFVLETESSLSCMSRDSWKEKTRGFAGGERTS